MPAFRAYGPPWTRQSIIGCLSSWAAWLRPHHDSSYYPDHCGDIMERGSSGEEFLSKTLIGLGMSDRDVKHTNAVIPKAHISLWVVEAAPSSNSGAIHLSVPPTLVGIVVTDGSTKKEHPKSVSKGRPSSATNMFSCDH